MVGGEPFLNILVRIPGRGLLIKKSKEKARGKFLTEHLHDVRMIAAARLVWIVGKGLLMEKEVRMAGRGLLMESEFRMVGRG